MSDFFKTALSPTGMLGDMTLNAFPEDVARAVIGVVAGAGDSDLHFPTPCANFDLKTLVNHFIGTTGALGRVGRREPLDPADPYGATTNATNGDWPAQLSVILDGLARAWADPKAWQGEVDMGGQTMPAAMIGEMAMAEVVLHGWDLARATRQRLDIAAETATELRRSIEATAELGRQMGAYGPHVDIAVEAGDFEHALAASGRNPDWTAS